MVPLLLSRNRRQTTFLIQLLEVSRFRATATETELAYFEPNIWEGYVYPIYIFRGKAELVSGKTADFVFYVDAIRR